MYLNIGDKVITTFGVTGVLREVVDDGTTVFLEMLVDPGFVDLGRCRRQTISIHEVKEMRKPDDKPHELHHTGPTYR